jgi:integrase
MRQIEVIPSVESAAETAKTSNVKSSRKYDRFGEVIRYLTYHELQQFFDAAESYRHKLMFQVIYELGCRVGEFVRIQLKHLNFSRSTVLIPAENTKTRHRRFSYLPIGLMNEITSMLKTEGRMSKREEKLKDEEDYLFHPPGRPSSHYSENRIRQIFLKYVRKAGLDREYGRDIKGRKLHQFTVHSMRHSHVMAYVHLHKLPLPVVQKQVGHRSLRSTSVYLNPSEELVAQAYSEARQDARPEGKRIGRFISRKSVVISE